MSYQYWQEISSYLDELDKERAVFEKNAESAEFSDSSRKAMVNLIENLKSSLEKQLDKHSTSLIIFAVIAGLDEKMQSYSYTSSKVKWVPLQKDFYSAYTAGEVFFKSIDEILEEPNTPNIVYQVYYAILKRGFQGKYQDSKTQIAKYLDMLKDKIPVAPIQTASKAEIATPQLPKKRWLKKWHYYGLSVGLSMLLFAVVYIASNMS